VLDHHLLKRPLAVVSERRVAEVMGVAGGLDQVGEVVLVIDDTKNVVALLRTEPERPADLRALERVCEACPEEVVRLKPTIWLFRCKRRSAPEWMIRSRSLATCDRDSCSSSAAGRPRVSEKRA